MVLETKCLDFCMIFNCVTLVDNAGRWTDYSRFKARKDETMTYQSCESNDRQ
jgi:hypothetical protein